MSSRLLPPDLWLPVSDLAVGAVVARCGYRLWWVEDSEDPDMLEHRCWHCRTCRPRPAR